MRLDFFLKPVNVVLISVMASLLIWAVPGESALLRGFEQRSAVTLPGSLVLVGWYALCIAVIWYGVKLGCRIRPNARLQEFETSPKRELTFYWFLTCAATIGIVFSVIAIALEVSIWETISTRNANIAAEALPNHASLATLRYATAVAAPIGIYLWQRKSASLAMGTWNILLLLANVILASRMSLIVAIIIYVFLLVRSKPDFKLKPLVALIGIFALFGGLTSLNYVRNANTYEQFDITSPIEMNFYQISAYLGAPAQVSIGVSNAIANGDLVVSGSPTTSLAAVLPTFLNFDKDSVGDGTVAGRYGNLVSVTENFNANSAFADVYSAFGWWGLFYTLIVLCGAAFLFGIFSRYRSVVAAIAAVLLYGFAEYWRGFMFNQGIHIFMLLVVGSGIGFAILWPRVTMFIHHARTRASQIRQRQ
ncbi:hypothetical protein E3T43_15895 [Cryobacterium sp. Hh7]|uniref:hypothetical protein n=1 Tax=Cryobacterium sp. Hh7 TaxID=1259159 RepID=UPI00106C8262|nr:hypothetical protein [Cryobacterium sp. Hh7]TFD51767.1 hypothetical protein E3T43_15895 [Cryobacterium sp. Hh7]